MTERWVLNASPIICLARAGQLDVLFELADELVVPRAVATELVIFISSRPRVGKRSFIHCAMKIAPER